MHLGSRILFECLHSSISLEHKGVFQTVFAVILASGCCFERLACECKGGRQFADPIPRQRRYTTHPIRSKPDDAWPVPALLVASKDEPTRNG